MKTSRNFSLFFVFSTLLLLTVFAKTSHDKTTELQRVSRAHLEFALDLFRSLCLDSGRGENVLLSPFSVASVLTQLWLGSGENSTTWKELEKVLHYKDLLSPERIQQVFHSSLDTLGDPDFQSVVRQANSIFLQEGLEILPDFVSDLQKFHNASVEMLDFEGTSPSASGVINKWVEKRTSGMIKDLLEGPLPSTTKLLLVNALALKAFWKNSFNPTSTAEKGVFKVDKDTRLEIPMMAGKFKVLLGESEPLRSRLLELPFRGKRLSMFLLLPEEDSEGNDPGRNLQRLERNLTAGNLRKLFSSLREEMVHIRLPRFSAEGNGQGLTEALKGLGLRDLFNIETADFTRISEKEKFAVNSLAHKVVLEITEKGARAAAATATGIERTGEIGEFFEVDRPFLFFIWDYHSGAVLFIGRVATPRPLPSS